MENFSQLPIASKPVRSARSNKKTKTENTPKTGTPSKPVCRLLDLPRELRDQIYEYALGGGVLEIHPTFHYEDRPAPCIRSIEENVRCRRSIYSTFRPAVSLLETCTQIYEEAGQVFYSKNVFFFREESIFESIFAALSFFSWRTPTAMAWIKSIKFEISVQSSQENELFGTKTHMLAWVEECMAVVRDQLPALEHLSLVLSDWPVDAIARLPLQGIYRPRTHRFPFGTLLKLLGKYKRFSMEIWARPAKEMWWLQNQRPRDPSSLIACAELFRSHLLRGGDALGKANISVHSRHTAVRYTESFAPPREPSAVFYMRSHVRQLVVRCDDDENGKSFLEPPQRLSPLWVDASHAEKTLGREAMFANLEPNDNYPTQEQMDYAESDDGDDDSLNEFELDDGDLEPVSTELLKEVLERL